MFINRWQMDTSTSVKSVPRKTPKLGASLGFVWSAKRTFLHGRQRLNVEADLLVQEPATINEVKNSLTRSSSTRLPTTRFIGGSTSRLARPINASCVLLKRANTTSGRTKVAIIGRTWKIGGSYVPSAIMRMIRLLLRPGLRGESFTATALRIGNVFPFNVRLSLGR